MVRTIPDVIDARALRRQFRAHPVVQDAKIVFAKISARDARLIGEDENEIAGVVQAPDGFCGVRHPANPVTGAHIAIVVVDDAITVEKRRGS
jgi:hypothetical protein